METRDTEHVRSLVGSLCVHARCGTIKDYIVKGRLVEGVYDCDGTDRSFRMLLDAGDMPIMATVEYGFAERTYVYIQGVWETA